MKAKEQTLHAWYFAPWSSVRSVKDDGNAEMRPADHGEGMKMELCAMLMKNS